MKNKYFLVLIFIVYSLCGVAFAQNSNDINLHSSVDLNKPNVTEAEIKNANDKKYQERMLERDSNWHQKREAYEQQIQNFINNKKKDLAPQAIITIPVVVHVLWNSPVENISDNQIFSQMIVLNEDFGRTNSDTTNTPPPFSLIAANTGIQFCLAQRDPNGNLCTGIERRQTTVASFAVDQMKFFAQGGLDIWDPTRYFNIWVCNDGQFNYGEFPTSTVSNTFGAVVHYSLFGSNYTIYGVFPNIIAPTNKGRSGTHEVGHCFNLRHIWADEPACTGSDFCSDTPNQAGYSSNCLTFPHYDACTPNGDGIMFQNYMDYSIGSCMNLFTQGQSARMNAVLSIAPYDGLASSNGCSPVVTTSNSGIDSINAPKGNICTATFTPVVVLKNFGVDNLTSCIINYYVDANSPSTFSWSGNLPSLGTTSVSLSPLTTTGGLHTFTAFTTTPNGAADSQVSNDSLTSSFNVFISGIPLPFTEGFESSTFIPSGWTLQNPDNSNTWMRTTQVFSTGIACAKMDNLGYQSSIGEIDEMITMSIDLTTVSNPGLTFDYAYTYYLQTNPYPQNYTDSLAVLISTDCGQTFSPIFYKGGVQLATVAPVPNGPEFVPATGDWQRVILSLASYQASTNAIFKFKNITEWGNQLYIDNINIENNVGVNNISLDPFVKIYPNPTDGQLFVDMNFSYLENLSVKILDVLGKEIFQIQLNEVMKSILEIDLSKFSNGIYAVVLLSDHGSTTQKVMLNK